MRLSPSYAVVLLLVVLIRPLAAQDTVHGNTIVFSVRATDETTGAVTRVVSSSIELHLEREGLFVVPVETEHADGTPRSELISRAQELETPWVLVADLSQSGQEVAVALRLFSVTDNIPVATQQATEPVGLTLDRAVVQLTDELIETAGRALAATAPESQVRPNAADPDATADRTPHDEGTSPSRPETGAIGSGAPGQQSSGTRPSSAPGPPNHVLAAGVRYTPFVPIAEASSYLGISPVGVAALVALLPLQTDLLAIGLGFNGLLSQATGASATAALQTGSLSLLLRLSGITGGFSPFVSVRGGVSLILAENEVLGSFFGLVPYGATQIGADLPISDRLSLQLAVDFELLLERSILIMGFSPSIGLEMRI